jgi:hypothetical protein
MVIVGNIYCVSTFAGIWSPAERARKLCGTSRIDPREKSRTRDSQFTGLLDPPYSSIDRYIQLAVD